MRINSNATKQMEALINKIDTFPNRIASIQQSALYRTASNMYEKMIRKYPAFYYMDFDIDTYGQLGYKLKFKPSDDKTSTGADAYTAVAVLLKGRKSYTVKSKGNYKMVLRDESVPPYPRSMWTANIPSMRGHEEEIKREIRENVIKNLQYAIKRFGFGPMGGSTGLKDLPGIRSRAGR